MSYCRWSTDSFDCDIYAYQHTDGGYRVHVSRNRLVKPLPKWSGKKITDNIEE